MGTESTTGKTTTATQLGNLILPGEKSKIPEAHAGNVCTRVTFQLLGRLLGRLVDLTSPGNGTWM
jgi:hypothetical protein